MEEDGWTDGPAARAEQLQCKEEIGAEDEELRALRSARDASGTFDAHAALIAALRTHGLAGALQQARQVAAASHPLPPAMYRQWIIDQAKGGGMSEDNAELLRLCEAALAEFQDVPIWETYLQICTGTSPCENGESEDEDSDADSDNEADDDDESRALFERAIASMGMHYSLGHRLFKQYREFERSRPSRVKGGPGDKVAALYKRQSGTPTKFAEAAMEALRSCDPATASQAEANHQASLKLRRKVEAYEAKVASQAAAIAQASDDAERLHASSCVAEAWVTYAAWAQETGEIPLALCIFERGVASSRSSPVVWTAYLKLASSLKDHALEGSVAARAARNCPQVLAFYEARMVAQEKSGCSPEEMDALKEAALGVAALSARDHCQIFLAHAAFCRRRLSAAWEQATPAQEDVVTWVQHLRASLGFALAFMEATSSDQSRLPLFHFYAAVEEDLIGDISGAAVSAEARAVWEACVSAYREDASSWQLFAAFERRCGEPATERAVYRRALNAVPRESSSPWASLCDEWLLMERLRGSLSDFEDASRWVSSARAELHDKEAAQERRAQREADSKKAAAKVSGTAEPASARPVKKRAVEVSDAGASATVTAKRTRVEATASAPASAPASGPASGPASEEGAAEGPSAIFVSNLPFDVTDESIREVFAASAEHIVSLTRRTNKAGRFRGMATVEFGSGAEALRVLNSLGGTATLGDRSLQLSLETQKAPAKPKQKKAEAGGVPSHPTTVFVAGLDKSVTDEGLGALFAGCGTVTVARVLLAKGTRESRGEGLVQFNDPEAVSKALSTTKDGLTVERSRFPAALPQSKKVATTTNPYVTGQAPKKEVTSEAPSGPSKFSFIPRTLRKDGPSS